METGSRLTLAALILAGLAPAALAQAGSDEYANFPWLRFDHPAIRYVEHAPDDAITRLQKKLDAG